MRSERSEKRFDFLSSRSSVDDIRIEDVGIACRESKEKKYGG